MQRGAPQGNTNAAKGKQWADALRLTLQTYESSNVKQGYALRKIAEVVVNKALEGDKDAINEIGNRLDGKPAQAIEGTGDGGAIILKLASADETI
jgi:hypothetical protein